MCELLFIPGFPPSTQRATLCAFKIVPDNLVNSKKITTKLTGSVFEQLYWPKGPRAWMPEGKIYTNF